MEELERLKIQLDKLENQRAELMKEFKWSNLILDVSFSNSSFCIPNFASPWKTLSTWLLESQKLPDAIDQ